MRNDFAISSVSEDHSRMEAALGRALKDSRNPALLRQLFECLNLAVGDDHLSDKYSSGIIAAIAGVCRGCSEDRRKASAALNSLEGIFNRGDANTRAYATDAACMVGTPQALRFVLKAAEDEQVLRRCHDIDDHIDHLVGIVYAADPLAGLRELGRMLPHPAYDVRRYAANRLLFFGEPGQPEIIARAAHSMLAEGVRNGCVEARILLRRGYRIAEFVEELPEGFRRRREARAACRFYQRVREGGEFAVGDECWRGIRPKIIEGEFQRPNRRKKHGQPRRPRLTLVNGGKSPELPR